MAYLSDDIQDPLSYSDYPDVLRLETTNKVYGGKYTDGDGDKGISNLQAMQLMERDDYILRRIGQASVAPVGDTPGKPGIAGLDTTGKVPDAQLAANVIRNTAVQTLTNKTISYADNTMPGVVGETAEQTITNKTISYAGNTMPGVAGTSAIQTLTNKTIDAKDNVMLCTATNITSSQTITPTKQMMVTAGMSGITLTLGSGPYAGYALPILAVADCQVSYTGIDGAATETLDVGSYITFIWDAVGSYWVVDAGAFEKPTYISTNTTLTPVKKMIAVVNTQGVELTLDDGPYDGFELPVLATADCQIVYTGINGSVTKNVQANTYNVFVWDSSNSGFWLPRESTAITGIDDNGQPFAFNVDALTHADGIINITGTDANGNPFDYGLGKLVTVANENNYSTEEVKTSKTWIDGKPIYRKVINTTVSVTINDHTTHGFNIPYNIIDLDTVVNVTGCTFDTQSAQTFLLPWIRGTDRWMDMDTVVPSNGGIDFYYYNYPLANPVIRLILEYTKTTDD